MARVDVTTVAPGVTRADHYWGYYLEGTKSALIACGQCSPDWFVVEGKCDSRGRLIRSQWLTIDGRKIRTNVPAKGSCGVWIHYTEKECEAVSLRDELSKAKKAELRAMAELPDSHERYREQTIEWVEHLLDSLHRFIEDGLGGYRFSPETVIAFDIGASNLLQTLHQGRSTFDRNARQECVNKIRAEYSKIDPGLQRFLGGLDFNR